MAKSVKSFKSIAAELGLVLGNALEVEKAPAKTKRPRIKVGVIVAKSYGDLGALDLRKCFSTTKVIYVEKSFKELGRIIEVPQQ
jgi:hypothetical protein